jgi:hypothetical protein
MKTNKEIKPFKMRCKSTDALKEVRSVLVKLRCVESSFVAGGETLLIYKEPNLIITAFDCMSAFNSYPSPELTYSEFMKLYGEEEEVFTREDMDLAMNWSIKTYAVATDWTKPDKYELLTKYLSERTND